MSPPEMTTLDFETVKVDVQDGIAWVTLNRPDKRNAMSPALNREMLAVLAALEFDDSAKVLVLTGAGDAFTAGMDLKEYFREVQGQPPAKVAAVRRAAVWQWRRLMFYAKPTIAMANGWYFGGAFTPLVASDLAIAADEATFGLSEINWGIIPAGNVTRAVAATMSHRDCLYYNMTGETFNGVKAAAMGLVNASVPLANLRARTVRPCSAVRLASPGGEYTPRGAAPADIDALADAVSRLGAAMRADTGLLEIDINPLVVYPKGQGVVALDALLVLADPP